MKKETFGEVSKLFRITWFIVVGLGCKGSFVGRESLCLFIFFYFLLFRIFFIGEDRIGVFNCFFYGGLVFVGRGK